MSEHEADVLRVVAKLEERRRKRGISQRELAGLSGLSHSAISEMESGKNSPTLHFLLRIASALEIDLGEIVTEACQDRKEKPTA